MKTNLRNRAAQVARTVLNFAAPALVLGLVLVSQVQARINYPAGPAGRLERSIDTILIKERADILLQNRLITQQNQTNTRINVLEQQLAGATDPNVIAALERQITQQQSRASSLQVQINRNTLVLRRDLDVLNPQKDRLIGLLNQLTRPRNQLTQFITAARQQENIYAAVIRAFLNRRPLSPVIGGGF
jgi:uncharacterized coiled-coil protein SlyX